jgi:hypothetical protein
MNLDIKDIQKEHDYLDNWFRGLSYKVKYKLFNLLKGLDMDFKKVRKR